MYKQGFRSVLNMLKQYRKMMTISVITSSGSMHGLSMNP